MKAFIKGKIVCSFYDDTTTIINYLNSHGLLRVSRERLEEFYREYSNECFCAGWMTVTDALLEDFANWLSKKEV